MNSIRYWIWDKWDSFKEALPSLCIIGTVGGLFIIPWLISLCVSGVVIWAIIKLVLHFTGA